MTRTIPMSLASCESVTLAVLDAHEGPHTTVRVVDGPVCPRCGSPEALLGGTVRPFKVDAGRGGWESNCDHRLFPAIGTETPDGRELDPDRPGCGIWFLEDGTITEERG